MRIKSIRAENVPPLRLFEADQLSDVVVIAGPNGVGKSRLVGALLGALRNPSPQPLTLQVEPTHREERSAWATATIDTANPTQARALVNFLSRKRKRTDSLSTVLYVESNRSIQRMSNFAFSFDYADPWDEQVDWQSTWSGLSGRYQDTVHSLFRKVHQRRNQIADRAEELMGTGVTAMDLNFDDPLEPFNRAFSQLLSPKVLLPLNPKNQSLRFEENGQILSFDSLSSGEREVVTVVFDLLLRKPRHSIIVFDEPELHLHPELSAKLVETLRSVGEQNQIVLCTHSPDIITASLDHTVLFLSPPNERGTNQAIRVREDDDTNEVLRLLGHSIGIVALGRRLVMIEGTAASLDKVTYGSILRNSLSNLVLVPSGGKDQIRSFANIALPILDRSLWGVEFFMLCDGDAVPAGQTAAQFEVKSGGRLRVLPRYHIENYFLDPVILAEVFSELEESESYLRSPDAIREALAAISRRLVPLAASKIVSAKIREQVGNVNVLPKDCHRMSGNELAAAFHNTVMQERQRLEENLTPSAVADQVHAEVERLKSEVDANRWHIVIPGKQLLAAFAREARMDQSRLKRAYLNKAHANHPACFAEIHEIFDSFAKLRGPPSAVEPST